MADSADNLYMMKECPEKNELLHLMHSAGFDGVHDFAIVKYQGEILEIVGSKRGDVEPMWWRRLEVEGSGFTRLFKGSILNLYSKVFERLKIENKEFAKLLNES